MDRLRLHHLQQTTPFVFLVFVLSCRHHHRTPLTRLVAICNRTERWAHTEYYCSTVAMMLTSSLAQAEGKLGARVQLALGVAVRCTITILAPVNKPT